MYHIWELLVYLVGFLGIRCETLRCIKRYKSCQLKCALLCIYLGLKAAVSTAYDIKKMADKIHLAFIGGLTEMPTVITKHKIHHEFPLLLSLRTAPAPRDSPFLRLSLSANIKKPV